MTDTDIHVFDAIVMADSDSVATVIESCCAGAQIRVQSPGELKILNLLDDIQLCHKVAIKVIKEGEEVRKNGQVIGYATRHISVGCHVHIHNLVGRDPADYLDK